ncbi:aminoglycoside phosphotransferase family protein [Azospirillum sp.]|uniref:phosphotransferase family protein n=1 Tax=Azospirillum sp. TaxID=34012 RepID=UPI002D2E663E|nr:aminoglycoside phosphotransferase family protein [Azospirillum sp.]HYD68729.1 aminoglycoside phosphotransferase family protein [Azospirillum sp.]
MTEMPDPVIPQALARLGLLPADAAASFTPLAGGVSSDIWRVEAGATVFCVKRALAKLKVQADWRAPVARNRYEVAYFRTAGEIVPAAVPRVLGEDAEAGLFAMEWLDPALYRLWKEELRQGRADPADAERVGSALVRIHSGTAGKAEVAARFPTDAIFHAIRLEPYLEATARRHPDLAERLYDLVRVTASTHRALVHGDVSPKNILLGPDGPVLLDAECAWYGDPAFDLAFCLNHMLLKGLWNPAARDRFLACFRTLASTYLDGVTWEPAAEVEARVARLLPGLFLGRVDGKSPVEYVTDEVDKDRVRRVAAHFLLNPADRLDDIADAWEKELRS